MIGIQDLAQLVMLKFEHLVCYLLKRVTVTFPFVSVRLRIGRCSRKIFWAWSV